MENLSSEQKIAKSLSASDILDKVNDAISKRSSPLEIEDEDVLELTEEIGAPKAEERDGYHGINSETSKQEDYKADFVNKFHEEKTEEKTEENKVTEQPHQSKIKDQKMNDLVSKDTAEATTAMFNKLRQSAKSKQIEKSLRFNSGTTVEEIVADLIKPQLSEWLDKNLPGIVKAVVEKEVKKLLPSED